MEEWKEQVRQLAQEMTGVPQISREEIPDIELYMDQLVTYLDRRLGFFRQVEDGPFITNAMINNYSKAKLVPPARSKRYGEDHVMALCLICQLKRVLPVQDMGKILPPSGDNEQLAALYELFLKAQREAFSQAPRLAEELIEAVPEGDARGNAAVIIQLAADAQLRLLLAQRLLDSQPRPGETKKK